MRIFQTTAVVGVGLLLLTGCSTSVPVAESQTTTSPSASAAGVTPPPSTAAVQPISADSLEDELSAMFATDRGLPTPPPVACKGGLEARKGARQACTVVGADGSVFLVTVTVNSLDGDRLRFNYSAVATSSRPAQTPTASSRPNASTTTKRPTATVTVTAEPGFGSVRAEICSQQDYFTISQGSGNTPAVYLLQNALAALNYDVGPIDGDFGSVTDAAVRRYQQNHGLIVDGIVGDQTWMSLRNGLCG